MSHVGGAATASVLQATPQWGPQTCHGRSQGVASAPPANYCPWRLSSNAPNRVSACSRHRRAFRRSWSKAGLLSSPSGCSPDTVACRPAPSSHPPCTAGANDARYAWREHPPRGNAGQGVTFRPSADLQPACNPGLAARTSAPLAAEARARWSLHVCCLFQHNGPLQTAQKA